MNKNVLVVSVHPDDETLGAGGTLLKHISEGDNVYCLHITGGNDFQKTTIDKLNTSYGFTESINLDFPELILGDTSLNQIIPKISEVFHRVKPNILYIPNRSDAHSDHRITFEALLACTKHFRYPFIEKVLMMEVQSETDFIPALPENYFNPNVFCDISDFFNKKLEIMKIFETELFDEPFTRSLSSIKAQARYRGSQINSQYAEAFMLLKEIC